jgi:ribosomal protein L7/L12
VAGGSDQEIFEIKQRLALIESRMEQLFEKLDMAPRDPDPESDAELLNLIGSGKTIEASKRYRELTGLGLAESKQAVDRLSSG